MGKIKFVTKVKKAFRDKITGNLLKPGETFIIENDTTRLNSCIVAGAVELTSVETDNASNNDFQGGGQNPTTVNVNGTEYEIEKVKSALSTIGAAVNANAKYNGVNGKIGTLTADQISALETELNK